VIPSTTTTPVTEAPARSLSPFYRRYLKEQLAAIGPDEGAKRQFLSAEFRRPMSAPVIDPIEISEPDVPDNMRGLSMAVVQGATFGFGDEAVGAMLGLMTAEGDFFERASKGIKDYREEYAAWRDQNKGLALGAEIVGGLATGGAGAAGKGALNLMARGAGFGALGGAGAVDNTELSWDMVGDRFKGALTGAGLGAATGGLLSVGGRFAAPVAATVAERATSTRAFGTVARAFGPKVVTDANGVARVTPGMPLLNRLESLTPEGRGRELVTNFMRDEGITFATALRTAQSYWARGQRPTLVDVLGPKFQEFAGDVVSEFAPGARKLVQQLQQRQVAQGEDLVGQLLMRSMTKNQRWGLANIFGTEEKLHTLGLKAARPHYEAAHEQTVKVTDEMKKLLRDPDFREAWNRAAKIANDEVDEGIAKGLKVPTLNDKVEGVSAKFIRENFPEQAEAMLKQAAIPDIPDELPVRGIDYMKRALQEPVLSRYAKREMTTSSRQLLDNELAVLESKYQRIVTEATTQVPEFGIALSKYGGAMRAKDAVAKGHELFSKRTSWKEIERRMKSMSASERNFFRIGATRAVYERVLATKDLQRDVARDIFGGAMLLFDDTGKQVGRLNGDARRVLALFGGNEAAAKDFLRRIAGEARMSQTVSRAVRLPKQVSTQKLTEADVGQMANIRGGMGTTVASVGRQVVQRERLQLSADENRVLTNLISKGLDDPDDLRVLMETLDYDMRRRAINAGGRALNSVLQASQRPGAF
jgi:hypothetical protein